MKIIPVIFALAAAALTNAVAQDNTSRLLEEERLEQSGTVISIIFDDSGSMAGEKIVQAKKAFRDWLSTVPDDYRIGLVALNAGTLVEWQRGNKSAVSDVVATIQAKGGTPLADTINRVRASIAKRQKERPFERHVMLVFTDGEDSTSDGANRVQQGLAKSARSGIETVGIGFHGHGDYMASAATRYFDAGNTEELKRGLEKVDSEIGDTSDIVISPEIAQDMKTIGTPGLMASKVGKSAKATATPPAQASPVGKKSDFPIFAIVIGVIVVIAIYKGLRRFF